MFLVVAAAAVSVVIWRRPSFGLCRSGPCSWWDRSESGDRLSIVRWRRYGRQKETRLLWPRRFSLGCDLPCRISLRYLPACVVNSSPFRCQLLGSSRERFRDIRPTTAASASFVLGSSLFQAIS